eukprot:COSAG05_NODE_168_length_15164_cov_8.323734_6_plen_129_part_00
MLSELVFSALSQSPTKIARLLNATHTQLQRGDALLFWNLKHDGTLQNRSLHTMRLKIIRNELIKTVGKIQSRMVSELRIIFKRTRMSSATFECERGGGNSHSGADVRKHVVNVWHREKVWKNFAHFRD